MRSALSFVVALAVLPSVAGAQSIIAQNSGLTNPDHVIDFGASLYPNFTPITTEFPPLTVTHARYFTTGLVNNVQGGFLTNDFSGGPDTLVVQFATPIRDLTFVYHQIATGAPSNFRALLGGNVVASFSNLSDQNQTNNYFGFTGVVFDELQLDFQADFNVDEFAFNDAATAPMAYCTSSTTTHNCSPSIAGVGTPSASAGSGFSIDVSSVEGQKFGLIFYGIDNTGFTPLPWAAGSTSFFCVKPPTQRSLPQISGGTANACDGALKLDWNAFIASTPGALGSPFGGGETVYAQAWFRDPPAVRTTNLSNALQFTVGP